MPCFCYLIAVSPSSESPKNSTAGSPTYATTHMNFGAQQVLNTVAYGAGNQDPIVHSNSTASVSSAGGNASPYYGNHGNAYQIYHPLQSISTSSSSSTPVNISPPPISSAGVSLATGPLYGNVPNASLTNYNYGSAWHPGDYFQNAYHYHQGAAPLANEYAPNIGVGELE